MAMKVRKLGYPEQHLGPKKITSDYDGLGRLKRALSYIPSGSRAFAQDLIAKHEQFGGWTERQSPYVLQLILRAREEYRRLHPREEAKSPTPGNGLPRLSPEGVRGLFKLFDAASAVKKKPFLLLMAEHVPVRLIPGREPGTLAAFDRDMTGSDAFMGTITTTGGLNLRPGRLPMAQALADAASRLGEDPATAAKRYGDAEAHCCFCARALTDERSVTAGYGPICAGYYNLPWGA